MRRKRRPRVWFVDDLEQNLRNFEDRHGHYFDVRVFHTPEELLRELEGERPDAILSDIYFYPPDEAQRLEEEVKTKSHELQELSSKWQAQSHEEGVDLIAEINRQFDGSPPFPVFAFTSKAPYLMMTEGFDRLTDVRARWLFKGKHTAGRERDLINRGIDDVRLHHGWRRLILQYPATSLTITGIAVWAVGRGFEALLRVLGIHI
jgi:hypothetical protein